MTHTMMATSEQSYSKDEQQRMIDLMRVANAQFYPLAQHTGCHTFIEFCGLQAKFIDLCQVSMEKGIEFPMSNVHTGQALALDGHHVEYLAEKFECIYGPAFFQNPKLAELFAIRVFGRGLEKHNAVKRGSSAVGAYVADLLGPGRGERVRSEVLRARARVEGAASQVRELWEQRDARASALRAIATDRATALKNKFTRRAAHAAATLVREAEKYQKAREGVPAEYAN